MSIGATRAGIPCEIAIDADINSSQTYQKNHPGVRTICDDIRNVKDFGSLVSASRKILFGGPPCQGFSTSNQKTRNAKNTNNWLFKEFLRVVDQVAPEWIVFENVKGIVETDNGFFFKRIINSFRRRGYSVNYATLDAADYGVPQHRSRVFIVGSKRGIKFQFPKATAFEAVTVGDAIGDLPNLKNGDSFERLTYGTEATSLFAKAMRGDRVTCSDHIVSRNTPQIIERYKYIPQGGNWADIPAGLMGSYADRTRCHTGIYKRLRVDQPSVVIGNYRKNMLIHPTDDRGLSVREAARLQSFPDSFEFSGSIGFRQQQVGNAVPPLLAEALFRQILAVEQTSLGKRVS
jgi:DNA (cytosine-5)-methyltransferase 1